ncbi:MAG TPA: ABC transporter permease [Acidimicrobiales bacterium]|nr:ABC transporter permease [Acidimicrobiales bacterium]
MRRVTLRSLWAHKRRLVSTVLAVVLGVAFMSGTFILSTTLDQSFDDLFSEVVEEVDALVQGEVLFSDLLAGDQRADIPETLVAKVRDVRGVAAAEGRVSTDGGFSVNRVIGADGEPIGGSQGSTSFESWLQDDSLNAFELSQGRAPEADDELVLNLAAAEEGGLEVGDQVDAVSSLGRSTYELVGTFSLGAAKSAGGTITVGFTLPEAQRLAGLEGKITSVFVKAADGLSEEELVERLAPAVGGQAEVVTGEQAVAQLSEESQTNLGFLEIALTVFGAIALLVGIFVISNTFSILVAQRTKELALLRALGASRTQVLGSVLLEAGVVGLVAAVLGVGAGLGLARMVMASLDSFGFQIPNATIVVRPTAILVSLLIGTSVTLLASLLPAIRATRVPPLAALRDVAVDRSNLSRTRIVAGIVGLALGAWALGAAWREDGNTEALPVVGAGGGIVVVGFLVVGPVLAGRTVRFLGLPLPRFKGVTGRLATENAARSPRRTSATASAVVIGVALVVFITVFAASATRSVSDEVNRGFKADFVVSGKSEQLTAPVTPLPLTVADTVREIEGVDVVSALGFGSVGIFYPDGRTATHFATALEPRGILQVFEPRMAEGDVASLQDDEVILDKAIVEDHDIQLGDVITITAEGGLSAELTVAGVGDDPNLIGFLALTRDAFRQIDPGLVDVQVAGTIEPGQDLDTVLERLRVQLDDEVPPLEVLDREGFIGNLVDQITSYITLIYALLVLSIITALVGIANTLSLSITERTRELGLLRAVGMDRSGVRSTVRWEASLISALGALVGVSLGMVLSVALVKAMQGFGLASFAFPGSGLVIVVVATIILGTLASIRPARRAAGLSILDAIATE